MGSDISTMRPGMLGIDLDDELRRRLSEVEDRLREVLHDARNRFVAVGTTHLIEAGGKRVRPLLALLGAQFGDADEPLVTDAAVITELVHVGTLHHDDVMDEALVRHGVSTANALWGNSLAVLLGDLLLARAAELAAELGTAALRLQATTLTRLVRGQLLEAATSRVRAEPKELAIHWPPAVGDPDSSGRPPAHPRSPEARTGRAPRGTDPMAHCLAVMADKSASLIAMAVQLGAHVSGAPAAACAVLARYGEYLGIAFQIADDVLDICSPSAESGKTPGTDLREGVVTVPMLHALAEDGPDADRLRVILAAGAVTDPDLHAEALELLRRSPGMARARADARRYAEDARAELTALPPLRARAVLEGLCDFVRDRSV